MSIPVRIVLATATLLILTLGAGLQLAKADGLPVIIPISGTATYELDWRYSISGPSLSFAGGMLVDRGIYTFCTQGTLCDLSATINAGEFCNVIPCSASFDGHAYNWTAGTLTILAAVVAPQTRVSVLTAPAIVSGELFAVDCSQEQDQNNACKFRPRAFRFRYYRGRNRHSDICTRRARLHSTEYASPSVFI